MSELNYTKNLFESIFPIRFKIIYQYQCKYPGLMAKFKTSRCINGSFCGVINKYFNLKSCTARSSTSNVCLYGRLFWYLPFFLFTLYSAEILLSTCVDNPKRDFWGPYTWPLDIHQYFYLVSSKNPAACFRSMRMMLSNQQPHRILASSPNQA